MSRSKIIHFIVSLGLGALFLWLALRGTDFDKVWDALAGLRAGPLAVFVALHLVVQVFRTMRYRHLVKPLGGISNYNCFMAGSVGAMAVSVLPFRLGDLVRPIVVNETENIPVAGAFGAVIGERILDGTLTGAILLSFVLIFREAMEIPRQVVIISCLPIFFFSAGFTVMLTNVLRPKLGVIVVQKTIGRFFPGAADFVSRLVQNFFGGFKAFADVRILAVFLFESILYWMLNAGTNTALFYAFGFVVEHAFALGVIMIGLQVVGMTIPGLPAGVGPFDYFTILSLTMVGFAKADAVAFAAVCHGALLAVTVGFGLIFLLTGQVSFSRLGRALRDFADKAKPSQISD